MSWLAIVLVMVSSAVHAGWNLLSKSRRPSATFFLLASTAGALCLSPAVFLNLGALARLPGLVWAMAAGAGAFMALYYAALAGAYRSGHLSVAYPLARSSPILVVTVVTLALGRGSQLSWLCALGSVMVVAGCFLVPMPRFADFRLGHYWNSTCALALLAAVGTTGYSILDDEALRLLRQTPGLGLSNLRATLLYACLEAAYAAVWLGLATILRPAGRADLRRNLRENLPQAGLAGLAIYAGYALILIAFAHARNVSYVVAFRQLSIPLGTGLGILLFREPAWPPKLVGVAVLVTGLILVAAG
jgi:drug/metabolite transporter (DMT)-like permease